MANQNTQTSPLGLTQDDKEGGKGSSSSSSSKPNTASTNTSSQTSGGMTSGSSSSQSRGDSRSGAATATARSFYDQAKETAGQAYEAVTDKAATKLDEQKSTVSSGLATVADSVRQVSQNLGSSKTDSGLAEAAARYTNTAARKLEGAANYFDHNSVRDMARDLESFARRNPAVFLGAAFGLGFLAARFLKSTAPRYNAAGAAGGSFDTASQTSTPKMSGAQNITANQPRTH